MSLLYLIRHGETDWNYEGRIQGASDVPLNHAGIKQMQKVAVYLKGLEVNPYLLLCSDACRCQTSAQIVGQELAVTPNVEPSLREVDYGVWTGRTISQLRGDEDQRYAWDNMVPDHNWQRGESFAAAHQRAYGCIETWLEDSRGETILVVTHGSIMQLLVSWWIAGSLCLSRAFTVSNGSISILEFGQDNRANVLGWNIIPEGLPRKTNGILS